MKKVRYKIYTLGCKVNQYDSASLEASLLTQGFEHTREHAGLAIINTCAVTKTAIQKAKRVINKAKSENPQARIVLMGCWPRAYNEDVKRLRVDLLWGVGKKEELVNGILKLFKKEKQKKEQVVLASNNSRSRYFLKIQDGCEQFCSYCIIPFTRGKYKSRNKNEIIKEAKAAVKKGYKEIVLTGIHLGKFNSKREDKKKKMGSEGGDLALLLEELVGIKDLGRIRLSSIEINEVSDALIKLISESKGRICKHLHIPLQSGCDKMLELMNRPYSIKNYELQIIKIRKLIPDIAITTDVIVGFPGENEKDFEETYNFIDNMGFSRLHVFPFSAHKKTRASKLSGAVSKSEKTTRAKKLRLLNAKLQKKYRNRFRGQILHVLVEGEKGGRIIAKTEYYFDVHIDKELFSNVGVGGLCKVKC